MWRKTIYKTVNYKSCGFAISTTVFRIIEDSYGRKKGRGTRVIQCLQRTIGGPAFSAEHLDAATAWYSDQTSGRSVIVGSGFFKSLFMAMAGYTVIGWIMVRAADAVIFMPKSFCVTYNTDALSGHRRDICSGSAFCKGVWPAIVIEFGQPGNHHIGTGLCVVDFVFYQSAVYNSESIAGCSIC